MISFALMGHPMVAVEEISGKGLRSEQVVTRASPEHI